MNSQRQASTFAIALLMAGLVIVVGLSAASITTEPEDLPWSNETDVIILPPPPPPLPINNETEPVIIVIDPMEELALEIDYLNTNLQKLVNELFVLQIAYQELTSEFYRIQTANEVDVAELSSKIDSMETKLETYSNEVNEQIESLENKISSLQTTIVYACIATAIIAMLGAFLLIKKMKWV